MMDPIRWPRGPRLALVASMTLTMGALGCGDSDGANGDGPPNGGLDAGSGPADGASADAGPDDAAAPDGGGTDGGTGGGPWSGTIGPEGGEIASADGEIRFAVPAGALAEAETITLTLVEGPASAVSPVVDLAPDGLTFASPATLTLPYDAERLPAGSSEADVVAAYLEEGAWIATLATTLDEANDTAVAEVEHFSVVGLTVRSGEPVRLNRDSTLGARFENRVLDSSQPDYIIEAGDHPSPAFRGIVIPNDMVVEPGVRFWMEEDAAIRIPPGIRLIARGTETAPIVFEGSSETVQPEAGHWRGLIYNSQRRNMIDQRNVLEHVVIRHAGRTWTEQNENSVVSASVVLSSHDFDVGDIADLHVRDSVIEDGLGSGIDAIAEIAFDPGLFEVDRTTFRRLERYPMALWPFAAAGIGEQNVYDDNGEERIWLRSGEVFNYEVPFTGVPLLYGMTDADQDAYPGFSVPGNLQVWLEMYVEAGATLEFKPRVNLLLIRNGANNDTASLRVAGTEDRPVIFRGDGSGERWTGIDVRSSSSSTVLRHAIIEDAGTAVGVGFGNDDAFVRLEDTLIRDCSCGVFRYAPSVTVELDNVTYENTPTEDCSP